MEADGDLLSSRFSEPDGWRGLRRAAASRSFGFDQSRKGRGYSIRAASPIVHLVKYKLVWSQVNMAYSPAQNLALGLYSFLIRDCRQTLPFFSRSRFSTDGNAAKSV